MDHELTEIDEMHGAALVSVIVKYEREMRRTWLLLVFLLLAIAASVALLANDVTALTVGAALALVAGPIFMLMGNIAERRAWKRTMRGILASWAEMQATSQR